jgi:hypothetical protein
MTWTNPADGTFGRHIPERYAALMKNPNTRASVPTKYLSPAMQKLRTAAQTRKTENATLYNPMASLQGQDLRNAVNAEVKSSLAPYDQQVAQLKQQGAAMSQRLGGYYSQLQAAQPAALAQQQSSASALAAQLAGIGQRSQDTITQAEQAAQARGVQDQALRGTGLDAGMAQRLAAEFAQQKGAVAAQTAIQAGAAGAQGQGFQGIANTAAQVLPARAMDAQLAMGSQQNQKINDVLDKRSIAGAGLQADTLNKLRQQQFENQAATQTLNLKGTVAQSNAQLAADRIAESAKSRRASERARQASTAVAQQNANTSEARLSETERHNQAMEALRTKAAKNPNALTPVQKRALVKANNDYRGKIRGAVQLGQNDLGKVVDVGNGKKHRITVDDVRQALVKKYGDGDLVDAAIDLIQRKGTLSVDVERRLKARHIGIPHDWRGGLQNYQGPH